MQARYCPWRTSGEKMPMVDREHKMWRSLSVNELVITPTSCPRVQRWPQLVGQHVTFLKWRLAVV